MVITNLIKRIYRSDLFFFSGVGKPDYLGLGHPGGLITRSSVVQIYSPLLIFKKLLKIVDISKLVHILLNNNEFLILIF